LWSAGSATHPGTECPQLKSSSRRVSPVSPACRPWFFKGVHNRTCLRGDDQGVSTLSTVRSVGPFTMLTTRTGARALRPPWIHPSMHPFVLSSHRPLAPAPAPHSSAKRLRGIPSQLTPAARAESFQKEASPSRPGRVERPPPSLRRSAACRPNQTTVVGVVTSRDFG
jgi:hypothetical protein